MHLADAPLLTSLVEVPRPPLRSRPASHFEPASQPGAASRPAAVDPAAAAERSAAVVGTADRVLKALRKGNDADALREAARLGTQLMELLERERHLASRFHLQLLELATARRQASLLQEAAASARDHHAVRAGSAGRLSGGEREVERLIRTAAGALEAFQAGEDGRGRELAARAEDLLFRAGRTASAKKLHDAAQPRTALAFVLTGTDLLDASCERRFVLHDAQVPWGLAELPRQALEAYRARDFTALADRAEALVSWLPEEQQFFPPGSTSFAEEVKDRLIGLRAALAARSFRGIRRAARRLGIALERVQALVPPARPMGMKVPPPHQQ